ncbi:MAG: OmpA family protein, partial [Gammaproteobacteria bacterium]|nr:OmpA family protein [Gammaproteobacteria bacterium]
RAVVLLLAVIASPHPVAEESPCAALIEQGNAQIDALQRHAQAIEDSLRQLNEALAQAEARNAQQTRQIEQLEAELRAQRAGDPNEHENQRREFFRALRRQLPPSALYEVLPERLIIETDAVYVFGTGEIGAEGQDRLAAVADTLRHLVAQLPPAYPWRLRIEGHSDSRPLRSSHRFASNWELSSARAVNMLKYLVAQGLPEDRLSAVGMAATDLRDPGDSSAAHRRNRRIEISLVYGLAPSS